MIGSFNSWWAIAIVLDGAVRSIQVPNLRGREREAKSFLFFFFLHKTKNTQRFVKQRQWDGLVIKLQNKHTFHLTHTDLNVLFAASAFLSNFIAMSLSVSSSKSLSVYFLFNLHLQACKLLCFFFLLFTPI